MFTEYWLFVLCTPSRTLLEPIVLSLCRSISKFWLCPDLFCLYFIVIDLMNMIWQESCTNSVLQSPTEEIKRPILAYAVKFLRDSRAHVYPGQSEAPKTPDIVSDVDMPELSWDDLLTEVRISFWAPSFIKEI